MFRSRSHARRTALAAVAASGALLAAACSSPPSTGVEGGGREEGGESELAACPLDALESASSPVEIELWYGGLVMPTSGVLVDLIEKFNASQDKVKVVGNDQGVDYNETMRAFDRVVATPERLPNIVYLEDIQLGKMVDSNTVLPAQSCMEADGYDMREILPAVRAGFSVDDVLYPGYMNVSTPILYYNKAHFEKAGLDPNSPPKTLDEMAEVARKIKEAGVAPQPIAFKAGQWFYNTWLAGAGVDAVNNQNGRSAPPTEADLTSDTSVALMKKLDEMNQEGIMNVFPVTEGNIDHYLALVTQKSSMVIETSTASSTIAEVLGGNIDASDAGEAGIDIGSIDLDKIGVVPGSGQLPGIEKAGQVYASGGAFYMINGGGAISDAEQAASWEFMKFMLQEENAKEWHITGGYLPVVGSLAEDPDVQEFQRTNLQGILLKPAAEQLAAADPDRVSPLLGPFTQYEAALQGAMERVLLNGEDPTKALEQANDETNEALANYND